MSTEEAPPSVTRSSPVRERAPAGPLERGALVGRYVVLDRVGEGSFGAVYSAYDPELDRRVALKLLHFSSASSSAREERLLREARALGRLAHPNIVAVFDVGRAGESPFLTLELVEGASLREWLRAGPRPWTEVLRVFTLAARGLTAAHEAGLVHRDFKPDNVLLSPDGRVRVADFGLARAADKEGPNNAPLRGDDRVDTASLTEDGALVGTPAYMAPEQLAGRPADARSDQYAFCVSLYEALYGARPFRAATVAELAALLAREPAAAPARPEVPAWLRELVLRGLRARPEERHPSMHALLELLPADPEADPRVSHRARAALVGALLTLQFLVGLRLDPPLRERPPQPLGGAQVALWVLFTLALGGGALWFFRARLLANRVSRQLVLALSAVYYTSVAATWASARLGASDAVSTALTLLWGGGCLVVLGISLHRLFVALGALSLLAGAAVVAAPSLADLLSRATPLALGLVLVARWGLAPPRAQGLSVNRRERAAARESDAASLPGL